MQNKLLDMITKEEFEGLLFEEKITFRDIARKYHMGEAVVSRAAIICNIKREHVSQLPMS